MAEFDIVIIDRTNSHDAITIVEVKKSNRFLNVSTFDQWIAKMKSVDAQNLVCVTEVGFSKSIMKRADQIGPAVRLLTLQGLERDGWPIPPTLFSETVEVVRYDKLIRLQMEYVHLVKADPNAKD